MIEPMMKMLMGSEPVWSASKALKFGRSNNTINQNGTEADKVNSIVTSEDPKKASAISISEECDGGFSIVSFSGLDSVKGSAVDSDPNAEDAKTASCNASSSESETTEASSLNSGSMTKSEVAKETGSHENAVGDTDDWVQVTNTNESTVSPGRPSCSI